MITERAFKKRAPLSRAMPPRFLRAFSILEITMEIRISMPEAAIMIEQFLSETTFTIIEDTHVRIEQDHSDEGYCFAVEVVAPI